MNFKRRISILFGVAIVGLGALSLWSVYRAYQTSGFSPTFAGTVTTLTLVVITAWYAWSTYSLLDISETHAEATRASFAPHIDGRLVSRGPDFFSVDLTNRGQGVATNIEIEARVYATQIGDFSVGDRYRYVAHVIPSLPTNTTLGERPVKITPKYFTQRAEEKMGSHIDKPSEDGPIPPEPEDVISYLTDYLSNPTTKPYHPTEVGDMNDLLDILRESEESPAFPMFEIWVRYDDTLEGSDGYEERIYRTKLDLSAPNFQQAPADRHPVKSLRGLRRRFHEHFLRRGQEIMEPIQVRLDVTPPYESDISAPVVSVGREASDGE